MPPVPATRVSDQAGVLAASDRARLESLLAERERATGAQMLIALFPSLEGENLEDFSIRLAQRWRAGQAGLDNGVILLAFIADRRLRLEVGYGLEARIPDAATGRIIRESVAPHFREGRYAAGLEAAVNAVYALVEPGAAPASPRPSRGPGRSELALLLVVAVVVIAVLASARAARRTPSAYTAGRRGWSAPPPVIFPPWGWGGGRGGHGGGGGYSPGGGSFGGGGASGDW